MKSRKITDINLKAASIRHTEDVEQAALAGADIATIPFKGIKDMYAHELTKHGL